LPISDRFHQPSPCTFLLLESSFMKQSHDDDDDSLSYTVSHIKEVGQYRTPFNTCCHVV